MQSSLFQRARVPHRPGVYIFRDKQGAVLYVGKAKNLYHRVASYFQRARVLDPAKEIMVGKIADLDYTVTTSENEALLLESTLIKRHQPPYNVILRDDKNFLYIKVTKEEYPTLLSVRRRSSDRARYFGPFPSASAVHSTLRFLKRLFRYRTCQPHQGRPCLDVHLGRCLGPCADRITANDYDKRVVAPILHFLAGETATVTKNLKQAMLQASHHRDYERAAVIRDQVTAIETVTAKQTMVTPSRESFDVISLARDRDWAAANLFQVRQGRLVQKNNFLLLQPTQTPNKEVLRAFLEQYYSLVTSRPIRLLVSIKPTERAKLSRLLGVRIHQPERGKKHELARLGEENAALYLARRREDWLADHNRARRALEKLAEALGLARTPRRIEAFDVSNIQGTNAVGSMVVFQEGLPDRQAYRRFSIRGTIPNDPAMLANVVRRRLQHAEWPFPDLLLLDGGKGQLSVVQRAIAPMALRLPLVALAKREEELFVPGELESRRLPHGSEELFLIQRIRDEAHRFAITFYRSKHRASTVASVLDRLPGIGPLTKKKLLKTYRSLDHIRSASQHQLASVVGPYRARVLKERLQ